MPDQRGPQAAGLLGISLTLVTAALAGLDAPKPVWLCTLALGVALMVWSGGLFWRHRPAAREANGDLVLGRRAYELAQRMTEQLADAHIDKPALWVGPIRNAKTEAARKRADKADNKAREDYKNRALARFDHSFQVPLTEIISALSDRGVLDDTDRMKINWSRQELYFIREVPDILVVAARRLGYPPTD